MSSGYKPCACRDCMEIAIGDDGVPAFCSDCEEAGCEDAHGGEGECLSPDAYGGGLDEDEERALGGSFESDAAEDA